MDGRDERGVISYLGYGLLGRSPFPPSPRSSEVGIPTQKLVAGPSEIVAGLSVAESDLLA